MFGTKYQSWVYILITNTLIVFIIIFLSNIDFYGITFLSGCNSMGVYADHNSKFFSFNYSYLNM
jgi:hypothetical protein